MASPYLVRFSECMLTACLSEVQRHQDEIDEKNKQEKEFSEFKAKLEKEVGAAKVKMRADYLAKLNDSLEDLQSQRDIYAVKTGYFYNLNFRVLAELDKRQELVKAGEVIKDSVTYINQADPALGKLTRAACISGYLDDAQFTKYLGAIKKYGLAVGADLNQTLELMIRSFADQDLVKMGKEASVELRN